MTQQTEAQLDDQELFHLAMEASAKKRHATAMQYLKRAVARPTPNPFAHFMLAAEYAQIGLNDRAIEQFQAALKLEPKLHAARFQLGLLQLFMSQLEQALEAWKPLEQFADADPYATFARGLAKLAQEDFAGAAAEIRRGIETNRVNPALNADMKRMLDRMLAQAKESAPQPETPEQPADAGHALLSAYTRRPS